MIALPFILIPSGLDQRVVLERGRARVLARLDRQQEIQIAARPVVA